MSYILVLRFWSEYERSGVHRYFHDHAMPMSPKSLVGNHTKGTSRAKCSSKKWCSRQIARAMATSKSETDTKCDRWKDNNLPTSLGSCAVFLKSKQSSIHWEFPNGWKGKTLYNFNNKQNGGFRMAGKFLKVYRSLDVFFVCLFCF